MGFCCKISWLVRRPMSVEVNSSVSEGASTKQLVHGESHEPGDSTNSMSIDSAPPFRQNTNDSFFGKNFLLYLSVKLFALYLSNGYLSLLPRMKNRIKLLN